jgi:processing peptidase subunit beta
MSNAPPLSAILKHAVPSFHGSLKNVIPAQQSKLANGFRIASQFLGGETCTVGVWTNAGSRYENKQNNGVAHFLEHLNFKGTAKRSRRDIEYGMEKIGAHLNAYTSREQTCYFIKCFQKDVADSVEILSDILLNSKRSAEDLEAERRTILEEKENVEARIDEVLMDHLHSAAFELSGMGLSILGPSENIEKTITKQMVDSFVSTYYVGPNMVLVGAGAVDHNQLSDLAAKHFGGLAGTAPKAPSQTRYMGGEKRETNELLPSTHLAIAFSTPGITHPHALKLKFIEQLLGNYSRDKGEAAYSCFTRAVVAEFYDPHVGKFRIKNQAPHNPIHSIQSFWTPYSDCGLLGFYAIVENGKPYTHDLDAVVAFGMREIVRITQTLSDEEFQRAKNQLKVQTLLHLDGTTNVADDIGRQVLYFGNRIPIATLFEQIDGLTKQDIIGVAHEYIYDKDPVVAAIGDLRNVPEYDVVRRCTFWNTL